MARLVNPVSQRFLNFVHAHRNGHAAHAVRLVLIFFVWIVAVGGCFDPVAQSINNAIAALQTQSTNWQATLQNLQTQLIAQGAINTEASSPGLPFVLSRRLSIDWK